MDKSDNRICRIRTKYLCWDILSHSIDRESKP